MKSIRYDLFPSIQITSNSADCALGWVEVAQALQAKTAARTIVLECYPGVDLEELLRGLAPLLSGSTLLRTDDAFLSQEDLLTKFHLWLGDDPVLGWFHPADLAEFFDSRKLQELRELSASSTHSIWVIGTGATLVRPDADVLIYADLARWEIQRRQRAGTIGNLGLHNLTASAAQKYKRAFFLDWRSADRTKRKLLDKVDLLLDTNKPNEPRMIVGNLFRDALRTVAQRPFRVVPFFDPGPWGGQWMREHFDLPPDRTNYAWCFDCVPEENSVLLGFGDRVLEAPALDVIFYQPEQLLGRNVCRNFGAEFPIRFDYLDTVDGGNLSLQVHPLRAYIREKFGMDYTQDESYYIFHAEQDCSVYLGLRRDVDRNEMERELRLAQTDARSPFPAAKYVNSWPARRHDHFLIPAGTIHCSGRGGVVLEISATPYIFTFKLWDWGRLGLDGKPRHVHMDHGLANLQWNRDTDWVKQNLINCVENVGAGKGWREERTGLHALEFIETRRHWFSQTTPHNTFGTVNVLNLVQGSAVWVESPDARFEPLYIRYGETFIVPASVGAYTIHPAVEGERCATMKAFVREGHHAS